MSGDVHPLLPGDGSPAAAAMARAQQPPTESQTAPPAAPAPGVAQAPAGAVRFNQDGTVAFAAADGRQQLIRVDELPTIFEEHGRLRTQLPELEKEAQATRDLLGLVGNDQRRMQQLQSLLDHWQTGRSLPPETFGFRPAPAAPAVPGSPGFGRPGVGGSFFDDEPAAPQAPQPTVSPELEELRASVAAMTRQLQQMQSQTQQQTEAQKAEARRLDIQNRFGAYSFIKENPRAMELALRQAEYLGSRDPRLGPDIIVRQVAQEMQDLLGNQAARMAQHARTGMPAPLGATEGIPFAASTEPPMTAAELRAGKGVNRIMQRLEQFAANRAAGTQS